MKKIGVIGSGDVAKKLSEAFTEEGFEVMLGTNHPEKLDQWQVANPAIKVGNFNESAGFGEILALAVKGTVAGIILEEINPDFLAGKIVIDTTNPIDNKAPVNNVLQYFTAQNKSLLEVLQEKFPAVRFVKAFNSIGAPLMYKPAFAEKPTMFICGDDELAKEEVRQIIVTFGFDVEDLGKKECGTSIESLCILWCIEGFKTNIWDKHAIKLIRK